MKALVLLPLAASGLLALACSAGEGGSTKTLKPGDPAPAFELPGSDGQTYRLADYRGKSAVVIAWFPKAATPG